jgi:hypothetical protein
MTIKTWRRIVAIELLILLTLTVVAMAHPFTIKCPIDGQSMMFDHQVGFGKDAVCWYSHYGTDPKTGKSSCGFALE